MDFLVRIASLVKKELLAVLRDKKKPDGPHHPAHPPDSHLRLCRHHERHPRAVHRAGQGRGRNGRPVHRGPGRHGHLPAAGHGGHGKGHRPHDRQPGNRRGAHHPPGLLPQPPDRAPRLPPAHCGRPQHEHGGHRPQLRPANRLRLRGGPACQKRRLLPGGNRIPRLVQPQPHHPLVHRPRPHCRARADQLHPLRRALHRPRTGGRHLRPAPGRPCTPPEKSCSARGLPPSSPESCRPSSWCW